MCTCWQVRRTQAHCASVCVGNVRFHLAGDGAAAAANGVNGHGPASPAARPLVGDGAAASSSPAAPGGPAPYASAPADPAIQDLLASRLRISRTSSMRRSAAFSAALLIQGREENGWSDRCLQRTNDGNTAYDSYWMSAYIRPAAGIGDSRRMSASTKECRTLSRDLRPDAVQTRLATAHQASPPPSPSTDHTQSWHTTDVRM